MIQLYQTVANKENPDYLETNGPILCVNNPWLGPGYYFWDSFLENAHWWGRIHYASNYMVCAEESDGENDMFDLVGNTHHLTEMRIAVDMFRDRFNGRPLRVARVLAFIKGELKSFPYKAVRANAINSKSYSDLEDQIVHFTSGKPFLELFPPIQICVYDKSFLKGNFRVIFPPQYCKDYTI
jgi:hypothetical protein